MPSWDFVRDMVLPALLYMVLPALVSSALVMAAVQWLGGSKQAAAGSAFAIMVGAVLALSLRSAVPLLLDDKAEIALASLSDALTLNPGETAWNRLPWAVLAALCVGRLAYLADVHASDGWLLRGGAAIAIAWWLIPEDTRSEIVWLAPVLAFVIWASWVILDLLATQAASTSVSLCLILTLLTAGQILLHAHSTRLMEPLIVLAFAFAGIAMVAWLCGGEFGGAIPAIAVALPALLLMGQRLTDSKLHWIVFALPACVPFLLGLTLPFPHWPKLHLHLVRLAMVLALLGATAFLAWQAEPLDFSDPLGE